MARVRGAWCVVRGAWCVVRGAWCVVRGPWSGSEPALVPEPVALVPGSLNPNQ